MSLTFSNPLDNPDHLDGPDLGGGVVYLANALSVPPGITTLAQGLYVGGATALSVNMTYSAIKGSISLYWDFQNTLNFNDIFSEYFPTGTGTIVDLIPVVAPFLAIQVANNDAGNNSLVLQVATCKATGGPIDFASGRVMAAASVAVPGSGTATVPISIVLPGGAALYLSTGLQAPVSCAYAADLGGNGTFISVAGLTVTGTLTSQTIAIGVPTATGELSLFNGNAAATTVNVAVTSTR